MYKYEYDDIRKALRSYCKQEVESGKCDGAEDCSICAVCATYNKIFCLRSTEAQ